MEKTMLLHIENLKKYYHVRDGFAGKTVIRAVDGVSLGIERGETLGLVGESGCGKTTLGRTILRLTEPDSGSIVYDGKDIIHADMRPYRSRMQIIFQDHYGSFDPRCRIRDIVAEGIWANSPGLSKAEIWDQVPALLESVGLDPGNANRYPHELSGGQRQRIGIARSLAVNPEFVVCDEPVSSLDVSYQAQIINLLVELKAKFRLTYLFISHDLSVVRHISDRIGVMFMGKLVEYGNSGEVTSNPAHPYTKNLIDAIPIPDPRAGRAADRGNFAEPADLSVPDHGCKYCRLCARAEPLCSEEEPALKESAPGHLSACHFSHPASL